MQLGTVAIKHDHQVYLRAAVAEAAAAYAGGDFPAGAVLVDEQGMIVTRSRNSVLSAGSLAAHAELSVMLAAQRELSARHWATTLYCSLEPCIMCFGAAVLHRVAAIVWAQNDYWAGATGSYNFASSYLMARGCHLVAEPYLDLRELSASMVRRFLTKRRPDLVRRVLDPPPATTRQT